MLLHLYPQGKTSGTHLIGNYPRQFKYLPQIAPMFLLPQTFAQLLLLMPGLKYINMSADRAEFNQNRSIGIYRVTQSPCAPVRTTSIGSGK
jgi:hypothetical protein